MAKKKQRAAGVPKARERNPSMDNLLSIAKLSKVMSEHEYQKILDRNNLTQTGIAELLQLGHRTSRRYAAGSATVPQPTAKLLRLLNTGKVTLKEVAAA